nr:hypothetical protein [Tanacetum cinerariifolium]
LSRRDQKVVSGKGDEGVSKESRIDDHERTDSSTQEVNTAGPSINTANTNINTASLNINTVGSNDPRMLSLEEYGIFDDVYNDREVDAAANTNNLELLTVIAQALEITKLKRRVKKLERRNKGRMIAEMDQDADVVLEEAKDAKLKLITEVVTAANETITAASTTITAAEAQVPAATLTVAPSRVTATPSRRRKGVVIRDPKEERKEQSTERINKTRAERAAKRQKLDEEVEELKRHLQIVPNEDDDVYIEATPLARKVPVVDYEIIE